MTTTEYTNDVLRTWGASSLSIFSMDMKLTNALMGLCGESGECIDILKKQLFQGHPLDRQHMISELGDVAYYLALAADALGVSLDKVFERNVEKRRRRYPNGFEIEKSLVRGENDL